MSTALQYITILVAIYLVIGVGFNVLLFLWAKLRDLDQQYDVWIKVLNSIGGFLYYLLIGSILWLPGLFITLRKPKEIFQDRKKSIKLLTKKTIIRVLLKPYQGYLNWLYDKYQ